MILENTGLETHESGTAGVNGIINSNWLVIDELFSLSEATVVDGSGTATLTVAALPTVGDTVTIGATVYTFAATWAVDYDVEHGADAEAAIDNLVAEINGDVDSPAHATVTAVKASASTMEATGPATTATTETFTEVTSIWDVAAIVPESAASEIDFTGARIRSVAVDIDILFHTSNLAAGRSVALILVADGSSRDVTYPVAWVWLGTEPTSIAAGKTGLLELWSTSEVNAGVVARWSVET